MVKPKKTINFTKTPLKIVKKKQKRTKKDNCLALLQKQIYGIHFYIENQEINFFNLKSLILH